MSRAGELFKQLRDRAKGDAAEMRARLKEFVLGMRRISV